MFTHATPHLLHLLKSSIPISLHMQCYGCHCESTTQAPRIATSYVGGQDSTAKTFHLNCQIYVHPARPRPPVMHAHAYTWAFIHMLTTGKHNSN